MNQLTLLGFAIAISLTALTAGAVAMTDLAPRAKRMVIAAFGLLLALALMLFGLIALKANLPA
jgi:hypothetical protein